jgi:hypothetical protein
MYSCLLPISLWRYFLCFTSDSGQHHEFARSDCNSFRCVHPVNHGNVTEVITGSYRSAMITCHSFRLRWGRKVLGTNHWAPGNDLVKMTFPSGFDHMVQCPAAVEQFDKSQLHSTIYLEILSKVSNHCYRFGNKVDSSMPQRLKSGF